VVRQRSGENIRVKLFYMSDAGAGAEAGYRERERQVLDLFTSLMNSRTLRWGVRDTPWE
jgi:hypothetical protein